MNNKKKVLFIIVHFFAFVYHEIPINPQPQSRYHSTHRQGRFVIKATTNQKKIIMKVEYCCDLLHDGDEEILFDKWTTFSIKFFFLLFFWFALIFHVCAGFLEVLFDY